MKLRILEFVAELVIRQKAQNYTKNGGTKINWFQHDADSTQDAKIKKLLIRHGAIGYAVYFHCLELIIGDVCETNITFELEHDSEIIADNLKIQGTGDKSGRDIVEDIMRTIVDLGLFTNENGHIFCYKLLKRINMSMTSNKGLREAIATAKEDNHDEIMTHHDNVMTHHATYLPTNQPTIPTNKETPDKPATPEKTKKQKKEFVPPTLEEAIDYIIERNLVVIPFDFINWYTKTDWKDTSGKKITNWKNKLLNWDARELKKNPGAKPYSKPSSGITGIVHKCPVCQGVLKNGQYCKTCDKFFDDDGKELYQ